VRKLVSEQTRQIIKYFALDLTAQKTAPLIDLTRKSVNRIYLKIRNRIAEEAERASPPAGCQIEVDESYFGARRVRGKRGRGAGGKTIIFGIYKRNGSVFTEIVPNAQKKNPDVYQICVQRRRAGGGNDERQLQRNARNRRQRFGVGQSAGWQKSGRVECDCADNQSER